MYVVNRKNLKIYATLKTEAENFHFRRPGNEFLFEDNQFTQDKIPEQTQPKTVRPSTSYEYQAKKKVIMDKIMQKLEDMHLAEPLKPDCEYARTLPPA